VLKAIGLSDEAAQASLRFSIGRYTTVDEIEYAIEHLRGVIAKLHKV
jgi:cysteine desulfurase